MEGSYGRLRPYMEKIRPFTAMNAPYTVSVFLCISPYTVTVRYDRNTITGFMAKYGRIRHRIRPFTTVYGIGNRRPGYSATTTSIT
jgi:hypothetical protein